MQRTPGMYTAINTQTQRTGLPNQSHSIVFVTGDLGAPTMPTPIYDTASADTVSGANSKAGRMMAASLSISQGVRVETVGQSKSPDGGSGSETGVCEPTNTSMLVDPPKPSVGETVHARYRVNGGTWQDYSNDYSDGYDPMFIFFEDLEHNGQRVFEPTGSGRVAAFRAGTYDGEVLGAARTEPFVYPQESVVQAAPTTIDFKVTNMLGYDLISNYFGEDTTIKSCAMAKWMGE